MVDHSKVFPAFTYSSLAIDMLALGLYFNHLLLSKSLDGTGTAATGTQSGNHSIKELVIETASGNRSIDANSD